MHYGERLGSDFVESRFDNLTLRTLQRTGDNWKDIQVKSRMGVGVTCYVDGVSGFSFTASEEMKDVKEAVQKAFKMAKASAAAAELKLEFDHGPSIMSSPADSLKMKKHPRDCDLGYKTDLVNRAVETAKEKAENVRNIRGLYGELNGRKLLANSDQSEINWEFNVVDLVCLVTSMDDSGNMVYGREGFGGSWGLEYYDAKTRTPEYIGEMAASYAKGQLKAKACPAGKFRALVENDLVGVLAHESFGHLSEGDFVVSGASPLGGKVGTQIGSEHATIIDTGIPDIKNLGGLWLPYDDQGIPGSKTVVLDKGILKHYLHNRGTASKLGQNPTGNARAVQFTFPPIPRMTNTYFAPGDLSEEEAIELLDTGIYAISTLGGQVQMNGNFLFKAVRGYWVEKGEIKHPIREVALTGNILDLLNRVEGGTKELKISSGYFGGCGKGDQYPLPTGLGGPMLVMNEVTFGGQAD